ncbi:MAG: expansin EXLX1 family cellulose-binding protein [Kofleriaceae bacterium]
MRAWISILIIAGCGSEGGDDDPLGDPPVCAAPAGPSSGEGTFYDATGAGNCSFDPSPGDLRVAAMNAPDYANAAWCGGCVEVTGPEGQVVVRIVDQCPECQRGDLDMSREAFAELSPLPVGRIPITWRAVACPVSGPISYRFKEGSNPWWTAIQVRNHRYPIAKLEVQDDGGTWRTIEREDYNYFVSTDGLGEGPYTLRVTDVRGHVIEDANIALGDGQTRAGDAQFPACSE